jgi:hypothetical protein
MSPAGNFYKSEIVAITFKKHSFFFGQAFVGYNYNTHIIVAMENFHDIFPMIGISAYNGKYFSRN